ncbi:hypothetical protein CEXT_225611 [Caerostris extrusa]|uniref:Uncharacterized protein n=1 Tax=Caerostris extrusa TaxID=172846 RepID=A0AAV4PPS3_CAEEX|nr:hypothetical protein CEXT_225611 [Caerostris extrusa]
MGYGWKVANIPESAIWTKGIINRCLNIERTNRLKKSNQELGLYRLSMPKPVSTPDFFVSTLPDFFGPEPDKSSFFISG